MLIKKTYNWSRRDFCATLMCEHCDHEQEQGSCYDDDNYYRNVIPLIECKKCGESSNTKSIDGEIPITQPKYEPHVVI